MFTATSSLRRIIRLSASVPHERFTSAWKNSLTESEEKFVAITLTASSAKPATPIAAIRDVRPTSVRSNGTNITITATTPTNPVRDPVSSIASVISSSSAHTASRLRPSLSSASAIVGPAKSATICPSWLACCARPCIRPSR